MYLELRRVYWFLVSFCWYGIDPIDPPSSEGLNHSETSHQRIYMAVCQNLVPLVNIKIAGKWMFIPLKMYL